MLPNATDAPDAPLTVSTKSIRAVEYDPIQHYVYWVILYENYFATLIEIFNKFRLMVGVQLESHWRMEQNPQF